METLEIDKTTSDLVITSQKMISAVSSADEKAQSIRLLLSTFRGEWIANPSHGVDHWAYLGQPYHPERTPALAQAVIRDALLQEPRITEVLSVGISFNRSGRTLSISVRCVMDGEDTDTEVEVGI